MTTNDLVNRGIWIENPAPCPERATFVIAGVARSGTSMAAQALYTLGIPLGRRHDRSVFEDGEIGQALDSSDFGALKAIRDELDARHDKWGFKRPRAYRHLARLPQLVRNPRVIIVFRDPLAVTLRNHISIQSEVMKNLRTTIEEFAALIERIDACPAPVMMASYEKALQFPAEFVDRLAGFCGLQPSDRQIGLAVGSIRNGPEHYLERSRFVYLGHVDGCDGGRLTGWVKVKGYPHLFPDVVLYVNGERSGSATANIVREDLKAAGHEGWQHGFEIMLPDDAPRSAVIEVKVDNSNIHVPNDGKRLSDYAQAGAGGLAPVARE